MTDVLSAFEYPHWLIVAGAILVAIGLAAIAFRQSTKADLKPTEITHAGRSLRSGRGIDGLMKRNQPRERKAEPEFGEFEPPVILARYGADGTWVTYPHATSKLRPI
jgi:hypothetical protein